ncbi:MAG: macro domain-containing protein [Synergistaceae bacterium]|jgi:O-acetyl-ADP-ribose deacetylase (regulator of RNase III)|nr:macro domain-containing protein [Synergistaceae bacterium]
MIEFKNGDILREDAEALVNTVNCVGIMGRGIALQFKKAYPENFKAYAKACKDKKVLPGRMFVFQTGQLLNPRLIVNFPTKRHWRGKSRIEDIESGLVDLAETIKKYNVRSIAIPPLGSGLGGLEWREVKRRIEAALQVLSDVKIIIFEPDKNFAVRTDIALEIPAMTAGRAALVELTSHYLNGLLDPFITLLELHKLLYFLQEAGEPLKLKFKEAPMGPYAENLRHVLNKIEGYMISGYKDGGDAPYKHIELVPGAAEEAEEFLRQQADTRVRLGKVTNLVEGFESPFGLELLATVHWVSKYHEVTDINNIMNHVYAWSKRKKIFTQRQIELARKVLSDKEWV